MTTALFLGLAIYRVIKAAGIKSSIIKKLCLPILLVLFMFYWLKIPEERIHFVEYGVLGYLCGWMLNNLGHWPEKRLHGLILLAFIGTFDELIQKILPNRIFDLHDIFFNIASSWCGIFMFFTSKR